MAAIHNIETFVSLCAFAFLWGSHCSGKKKLHKRPFGGDGVVRGMRQHKRAFASRKERAKFRKVGFAKTAVFVVLARSSVRRIAVKERSGRVVHTKTRKGGPAL